MADTKREVQKRLADQYLTAQFGYGREALELLIGTAFQHGWQQRGEHGES